MQTRIERTVLSMMKFPGIFISLLTLYLILNTSVVCSQAPGIAWTKVYGGSIEDAARAGIPLSDGTYIIAGKAYSFDGQVTTNHSTDSTSDFWVLKLDANGNITKKKSFGGSGDELCEAMIQLLDGTFILAGSTTSADGDVTGFHGNIDIWVVHLSSSLTLLSETCYGGSKNDQCFYLDPTHDGGYVITGWTKSNNGDVSGLHGTNKYDLWILKIGGNNTFKKCIGGTDDEIARSGIETKDHGFIIGGYTYSHDGDVAGFHGGDGDMYVVKLDSTGNIQWSRCYGGSKTERLNNVIPVSTGGYLVVGYTQSNDGDALSNTDTTFGNMWLVRIDDLGNILWEKTYGGSHLESIEDILEMADGSFTGIGYCRSVDGDIKNHFPGTGDTEIYDDCWLFSIDASGNLLWQGCYGGNLHDLPNDIDITPDGYWLITGESASTTGQIKGNHGDDDYWVMKTTALICAKPVNLITSSIISNSATLSWDPVPGARTYSLHFRKTGASWSTYQTTALSWQANNLLPLTSYEWQVKALCDSSLNQQSDWAKKKSFTTSAKTWNQNYEEELQVVPFPNPFSSSINLKPLYSDEGLAEVTLFSISGTVILKAQWNENEWLKMNTEFIPPGIYFLVVKSGAETKTVKVIKE